MEELKGEIRRIQGVSNVEVEDLGNQLKLAITVKATKDTDEYIDQRNRENMVVDVDFYRIKNLGKVVDKIEEVVVRRTSKKKGYRIEEPEVEDSGQLGSAEDAYTGNEVRVFLPK